MILSLRERFGGFYLPLVLRFLLSVANNLKRYLIPLFVYTITNSIFFSALVLTLEWLPKILSFLFLGRLIDSIGERVVFLWCCIFSALLSVGLIHQSSEVIYTLVLSGAISLFGSLSSLCIEKLASKNSTDKRFTALQGKMQQAEQLCTLAMPVIASYLIYTNVEVGIYLLSSAFLLCFIVGLTIPSAEKKSVVKISFSESLKYIVHPKLIRYTLSGFLANMTLSALIAFMPETVTKVLGGDVSWYGITFSFAATLTLISIPILTHSIERYGQSRCLNGILGTLIIVSTVIALNRNLYAFIGAFALLSCGVNFLGLVYRTERVKHIPQELFANTVGVLTFFMIMPAVLASTCVALLSSYVNSECIVVISCLPASIGLLIFLATTAKHSANNVEC
ncbi:MFS transporter [Vibrio splendidus]|uniref:MFS transporter n=1 Tax=Vibrio splendidus TaxID=29497 RepID=A0ABV4LN25_VIBSP